MELGMVGLGSMGANMVERLVRGGHRVVGYDRDAAAVARVVSAGAEGADSLASLAEKLERPERYGSWFHRARRLMKRLPRSCRIFQKTTS